MKTKRTNKSNSYTTKRRRLSKNLYLLWDKNLIVQDELKKLRKHRLGISQVQWDHIQNQLCVIGCLTKKDENYCYPMVASKDFFTQIPDSTYVQLMKHLRISDLFKLCIWRYANYRFATPPEKLQDFFTDTTTNDMVKISIEEPEDGNIDLNINTEDELYVEVTKKIVKDLNVRSIRKKTKLKINDEYTVQNVEWTVHQREVARNTRNHFLYNFQIQYPMISDIELVEDNKHFVSQFLIAFLKANVSPSIISDMCLSCFGLSNLDFELEEKNISKETLLKKEKVEVPMQRTSITDFSYMEKQNKAARTIQRAIRRVLQRKRKAVQIIERFWFPYLIENEVEREVDQRRLSATIDRLDARNEFKYEEFKEEIIEDFKELNIVKHRGVAYWLKIYFFITVAISFEYVMGLSDMLSFEFFVFTLWILFQGLTMNRLNQKVLFFQTVMLIALTCRFLNVIMQIDNAAARFFVYVIIVNVCRQYWLFGLIAVNVIRFALLIPLNFIPPLRPNEGFVFIYDIYSVITIAACHRVGNPIEMLHKWMVGVIFFAVIASGVAIGYITVVLGC